MGSHGQNVEEVEASSANAIDVPSLERWLVARVLALREAHPQRFVTPHGDAIAPIEVKKFSTGLSITITPIKLIYILMATSMQGILRR